ncbi:MAG: hypothetical protein KatS3mg002_0690 [Candidatus Woesearchaeota archaeon]|nr:MAG: hypothetical protein KatS3mg002_0690 [Candidatus Woesearchaeota archaeon]
MRLAENSAMAVAIIIYIGTLLLLSLLTETSIFIVFVATLPLLLYLISLFYLLRIEVDAILLWFMPLIFPLMFLIIWYTKTFKIINSTDGPVITIINIIISYIINIFVLLIIGVGKEAERIRTKRATLVNGRHVNQNIPHHEIKKELEIVKEKLNNTTRELKEAHIKLDSAKEELVEAKKLVVSKENLNVTLRGIEDKCKAINFVIGRVYSDKRGASQEIRDKLKIDSEWYNTFSEIKSDIDSEAINNSKIREVLNKILDKLLQLEQKESNVIEIKIGTLPIYRKNDDRIIDVLARNDKDPIMEYHAEAKEICEKTLKYLDSQEG